MFFCEKKNKIWPKKSKMRVNWSALLCHFANFSADISPNTANFAV